MGKRMGVPEAAKAAGLTEYALRTGIKQGRYPFIRVGLGRGRIIIDIDLLQEYIEQEMRGNVKEQQPTEVIHYGQLRRVSG